MGAAQQRRPAGAGAGRALLVAPLLLAAAASGVDAFTTQILSSTSQTTTLSSPGAGVLQLQPLLDAIDANAVCMDGTGAAYYLKPGLDLDRYILYLEGGYWCFSAETCQQRCQDTPWACSTNGYTALTAEEGLFSSISANAFESATLVLGKYCSSDGWLGDVGASDATFGYSFRGARIINATIAALVKNHGLGSRPGQQLLFGGCSAGGRGASFALDSVTAQLEPLGVTVLGLVDASAWVDVPVLIPGLEPLQDQAATMVELVQPALPPACAADNADSLWKCIWPSYLLPYVRTPFFLSAFQWDAFQIMYSTNNQPTPNTPGGAAYLDEFQSGVLALIAALPAGTGVWSPSCLGHCMGDSINAFCFSQSGYTMAQALSSWLGGGNVQAVGQCVGWNCTTDCGKGPMAMWDPENTPPNNSPVCAAYYQSLQAQDQALAAAGQAQAAPQLGLGPAPAQEGEGAMLAATAPAREGKVYQVMTGS